MENEKPIILVTGFGPFGEHSINASWEAVKLLPDELENHHIIKYEMPVSYKDVDEKIPKIWSTYHPKFMIHVGVSKEAKKITIETVANSNDYERLDCYGNKHPTGSACGNPHNVCISTTINVEKICETLNEACGEIKYTPSENAGRFLCEYIYYSSLRQDKDKCIFIHVPTLNVFSAQQLSDCITSIIKLLID